MTIWAAHLYVPAGTNIWDYLNDAVYQLAKDAGFTHLNFWQYGYNARRRIVENSEWEQVVNRLKDFGLKPQFVLEYNVDSAVDLVQRLGSDCNFYEVCKEPHIRSACITRSAAEYVSRWNQIVDACKPLVSFDTLFGGPAVGVMSSSQSYMRAWLEGCEGDFASYHAFPGGNTKAASIDNVSAVITRNVEMYKNMIAEAGKSIPIAITEAQYTSGQQTGTNPATNWSYDPIFITEWTRRFFNTCMELDVYTVVLWLLIGYDNNFPIIRPPYKNYAKKPQYHAVKEYLEGVPPPLPAEPEPEPEPEPPVPGCITAFLLPLMGLGTLLPYLRLFRSHLPKLTVETYYTLSNMIMGVIT